MVFMATGAALPAQPAGRGGRRARWIGQLQWNAHEVLALERSERLQAYGLQAAATAYVSLNVVVLAEL